MAKPGEVATVNKKTRKPPSPLRKLLRAKLATKTINRYDLEPKRKSF
jgi:hypothetical protein